MDQSENTERADNTLQWLRWNGIISWPWYILGRTAVCLIKFYACLSPCKDD